MATSKMAEVNELCDRIRKVGWEEVQSNSGVAAVFIADDGARIVIHSSPAANNWYASKIRQLNRHGFAEAEARTQARAERRRKAALKADAERAETALLVAQQAAALRAEAETPAAKRQLATVRAAGPYAHNGTLPGHASDIDFLLAKHREPSYHRVNLTPAMARRMLERNTANVKQRPGLIEDYRTWMAAGDWLLTPQAIAFDTEGILMDGQHRLEALALLTAMANAPDGVSIDIFIAVGFPRAGFVAIDAGRKRTANDILYSRSVTTKGGITALARLAYLTDHGSDTGPGLLRGTHINPVAMDAYLTDEAVGRFNECLTLGARLWHTALLPKVHAAFAVWLIRRANPRKPEDVAEFFAGLIDTLYDEPERYRVGDDPRRVLRQHAINLSRQLKVSTAEKVTISALTVKTFNAWAAERVIRRLGWDEGTFPHAFVMPPPEPHAQPAGRHLAAVS